ncbi:hypothetical protein J2S74_003840 [Evansella vedderi]|uniref:Uncharacterized protein n=1 Tax=Evansella vedderi TaxID=38282 RepID=A0ABU0A237_9BACI|nr:hypothetical protein [Evansella vedderi]MDQ0256420.1 hypothetical protein [Evansella vedderi]
MKDQDWITWQKKVIFDEYAKPSLEKDEQGDEKKEDSNNRNESVRMNPPL